MNMAEFFKAKEQECIELAKRYERCPEDRQKAEGARQARKEADFYHKMAEQEAKKA